jgi:hypothetical protein
MWHGHQLDATKNYRAVNPSVLHDASSEGLLIRRSFAIHDGESHYVRRTSSIHAGSSIDVIESKLSRLPRLLDERARARSVRKRRRRVVGDSS